MIDSVLKGTGNSRFLKSAVPAGTSWADALAMLQAGTFPIDFNGINTEGFQQVGTPLNKANLLKDATAAQIGLPPSTTPDGMFQALGNTGELHVWRKTVVTTEPIPEVPAGYNLGTAAKTAFVTPTNSSNSAWIYKLSVSKTVFVDSSGNVSLVSPETKDVIVSGDGTVSVDSIIGSGNRFFSVTNATWADRGTINIERNVVYYVAPGTTFTCGILSSRTPSYFDAAQKVVGYPVTPEIPAGTTTTYPVSTNPNAYQEGDDAKAAGYTLGEVETGKFKMSASPTSNTFYVNSTIEVTDDGTITFPDGYHFISIGQNSSSVTSARDVIGNFMSLYQNKYDGNFEVGDVWFIPSDATITDYVYVTKRQRVTGYAAIPAGTTIEYLGKLGDKTRVTIGSYIGTGVCGAENPTKIKTSFPPKLVAVNGIGNTGSTSIILLFQNVAYASSDVGSSVNFEFTNITWLPDGVRWYSSEVLMQGNKQGATYKYIVIG